MGRGDLIAVSCAGCVYVSHESWEVPCIKCYRAHKGILDLPEDDPYFEDGGYEDTLNWIKGMADEYCG